MAIFLGIVSFLILFGAARALVGESQVYDEPEDEFEEWLLYEADDNEY